MIAAADSGQPADNDGLAARARQLGTEHGQIAGEKFPIPDTATAQAVAHVLDSGNVYIEYRVSQGVETSPQRMCQGLGIDLRDSRMAELWAEYGTSYNEAANAVVRRRAETMLTPERAVEEHRWDVRITVSGGEDIRHLISHAMTELAQTLCDHGVHAEATAFRPNGDAYDSWGSYPD